MKMIHFLIIRTIGQFSFEFDILAVFIFISKTTSINEEKEKMKNTKNDLK